MTRTGELAPRSDRPGEPTGEPDRRRVPGRAVLPGTRAVVGALLMVAAGLGTFLAWQQAVRRPSSSYVVADRAVPPGHRLTAEDLRMAPSQLSGAIDAAAFSNVEAAAGRVTLGPLAEGELLQAGNLGEAVGEGWLEEVAVALPRDRAVDGRLQPGDRVDVFVTDDDRTRAVAEDVPVLGIGDGGSTLAAGGDLTVILGLDDATVAGDLIHAVRVGEVTLVRTTYGSFAGDGS